MMGSGNPIDNLVSSLIFVLWIFQSHIVPQVPYEVNISVAACGETAQVASQIVFTREGGVC